jgi:hypothetical protein
MRKSHTEVQSYGMSQFTLMGMESSKSLELEQANSGSRVNPHGVLRWTKTLSSPHIA